MSPNLNVRKVIGLTVLFVFLANSLGPIPAAQAQEFILPKPGVMVPLSPAFDPPVLKGIKVYAADPFRFDFILDKGDGLRQEELKSEAVKLIKYFLASLTTPEKDLWVNLSPYEKDRIIPQSFGLTQMGRDLLAEDYMLKQITASLIYPEDDTGRRFWNRVYEEAQKRYGTTDIPVNTFNKVWIVPQKAAVYENTRVGSVYVVESSLKVMLEEDYLSLSKHRSSQGPAAIGSQVVREIVIPELTKEINEDRNFTQLRQIYNSLILATWYKEKIKNCILNKVYSNHNKIAGINIDDPQEKQKIYERYLQAFKKGVYNYIKEDQNPLTGQSTPRKYFSGGYAGVPKLTEANYDQAMEAFNKDAGRTSVIEARLDRAMMNGEKTRIAREKIKEMLDAEPDGEKLTIRQITDRLGQVAGFEDVTEVVVRNNYIGRDEQLKHHASLSIREKHDIDAESLHARRDKIKEILDAVPQGEKLTIRQITDRLHQTQGYEHVEQQTVDNDITNDGRLTHHAGLSIRQIHHTDQGTVHARRDKIKEILDAVPPGEQLTINQITYMIHQIPGYEGVDPDAVRNDINLDSRLTDHPGLKIEKTDLETMHARRAKIMEILDAVPQGQYLTIREITEKLHQIPGYEGVAESKVKNDFYLDDQLGGHIRLKIDKVDLEATKARRDKIKEILDAVPQGKRLTVGQVTSRLDKMQGYKGIKEVEVRGSINHDDRLRNHPRLVVRETIHTALEAIKARREKILEILDAVPEGRKLTTREVFVRLNHTAGYEGVTEGMVRNDIYHDNRLNKHAKLSLIEMKQKEKEAVLARREKLREILDAVPKGKTLTLRELTVKFYETASIESVPPSKIKNDIVLDDRLKFHEKLSVKRTDRKFIRGRPRGEDAAIEELMLWIEGHRKQYPSGSTIDHAKLDSLLKGLSISQEMLVRTFLSWGITIKDKDKAMTADQGQGEKPETTNEVPLKVMFKHLFVKLAKFKIYYDQDLNNMLLDILVANITSKPDDFFASLKKTKILTQFFNMTNKSEYLADELFAGFISDMFVLNFSKENLKSEVDIGFGKKTVIDRKEIRDMFEAEMKSVLGEERQEVKKLAEEETQRKIAEAEAKRRERNLKRQEERINNSLVVEQEKKPAPPVVQGQPQQPRIEKVKLPTKDSLELLFQKWDKGNGLGLMARKSPDLNTLIKKLSSDTDISPTEVEARFALLANAQGMSQEEFFEYLSRKESGQPEGRPASQTPHQKPGQPRPVLNILIYKNSYIDKNWERSKDKIIAKLNDAFSEGKIEATTKDDMYRWVPGIYRFKITGMGSATAYNSLYVRFYKEEKKLLVLGYASQWTFHVRQTKLKPDFIGFLQNFHKNNRTFEIFTRNVKKETIVQIQDSAMQAKGTENTGGIDFTANKIPLHVEPSSGPIQFSLDPAMLEQLQNAPGFVPVVINIHPMTDLGEFLGLKAH